MSVSDQKIAAFSKTISQLRDQPNMQPAELKAYFDSSPEELRQAHNGLCDALYATSAASSLGFQRTAGVPADTVQAAVENVQAQVTDAVLGNIPSGSVDGDKLAQDVRNHFSAIESAAAAESSARQSIDSNLQSQISTLSATKCELYTGTYVGDGAATRTINLGFRPKAVLVMYRGFLLEMEFNYWHYCSLGGIAIEGWSNTGISLTSNGFQVQQNLSPNSETGMTSIRVNTSGYTYVYLAFK